MTPRSSAVSAPRERHGAASSVSDATSDVRIDVIAVTGDSVEWIKGAVTADLRISSSPREGCLRGASLGGRRASTFAVAVARVHAVVGPYAVPF